MQDEDSKFSLFSKHFSTGVTTILVFVCLALANTWRTAEETKNDVIEMKKDVKAGMSERFKRSDAERHSERIEDRFQFWRGEMMEFQKRLSHLEGRNQ